MSNIFFSKHAYKCKQEIYNSMVLQNAETKMYDSLSERWLKSLDYILISYIYLVVLAAGDLAKSN